MLPVWAVTLLGLACGSRDPKLETQLNLLDTPAALDEALVLVDTQEPRAFMLKVTGKDPAPKAEVVPLPHNPQFAVRRKGAHDEILILCRGQRASSSQNAEQAKLIALEPSGKKREYVVRNPYDRLEQSDDGQYAFLFKGVNAQSLLDNPNEVAILDLDKQVGEKGAVTLRTLRSFGDSPLSVSFSPPMQILDQTRRLAVVLSNTNVTLIDLANLDRRETTVQLSDPGGTAVAPSQVVFGLDQPEVYVRGQNSSDVFVFNLTARPGDDQPADGVPHNDFRPSIDQLGVGGHPNDMALYQVDGNTRLLVLSDGKQIAVVDASTSQVTNLNLPDPAQQILLFDAVAPHDSQVKTRALLYQLNSLALTFLDLADVETRGSRNLESLALERPIAKLLPMLEEHLALIIHDQGGVSLLDLADRTVSPIRSSAKLTDAAFDAARGRLWVGPTGFDRVGWLDLKTGNTQELLLDAEIKALVPMFALDRVLVLHESPIGYATVLSASDPRRETALSLRGFLVSDLLEGGP